ncbi:MAG: Gfo/Idh/MocA family oxidoreductase [Bacillota bacterium]
MSRAGSANNEPEVIRVGVLGTGAIARIAHLPALNHLPGVQVTAVADVDRNRAEQAARRFSIPRVCSTIEEMVAQEPLDAVIVCTPNYLHAEHAVAALKAGKHVLVEKPIATTLADALAMKNAAREAGRVLMVGFTHRFYAFNRYAHKLVQEGAIGRIVSLRMRFSHEGPYVSWPAESRWFLDRRLAGGGALLDMGIHAVDLASWLVGADIREVAAMTSPVEVDSEVERTAHVLLHFAGGALGAIEVGWSTKDGALGYELYGTEGSMLVDYQTPIKLLAPTVTGPRVRGWIVPSVGRSDPYLEELRHFFDCVRTGESPVVGAHEGIEALRVILAAYDAAESGRTVHVA